MPLGLSLEAAVDVLGHIFQGEGHGWNRNGCKMVVNEGAKAVFDLTLGGRRAAVPAVDEAVFAD